MSSNPATQPLIDAYVDAVNQINELDEQLGNVQSSGRVAFNALVQANPDHVASAQAWLQEFKFIEDETQKLIWAHVLNQEAKKGNEVIQIFIKANSPEVAESTLKDDERTVIATQRSETQKLAKSLKGTLDILLKGETDLLASLPECPEGIRGAIGKRGAMGRKIESNFFYTVNGEEIGVRPLAEAAKFAKLKASAIRRMVTEQYPDGTPDEWQVQVGMTVVHAKRDSSVVPDLEDDDDDEDTDD